MWWWWWWCVGFCWAGLSAESCCHRYFAQNTGRSARCARRSLGRGFTLVPRVTKYRQTTIQRQSIAIILVVTLWDYEPNWLIVRLIVQTYVGIVLLSILSAPFSPPKKIIQNWLTNTYHGILKPYYDVSQMIYGISASWICSSDSGLGFQSLGQVKGNGKCDPPLTWSWTMSQTMSQFGS